MNKLTYTASKKNTTKSIEYWNPVTQSYQDSNIILNIPDGTYTVFKARLKTSNPEIVSTKPYSLTFPIVLANYILIDGQSNALGAGNPSFFNTPPGSTITPSPTREYQRVYIWVDSVKAFQKLKLGVNHQGYQANIGQEIGLAERFEQENPTGNLYIIKHSLPGVPISRWNSSDANYVNLKTEILDARANLINQGLLPVEKGWIWSQGESDTGNASYKTDWLDLRDRMIADGILFKGIRVVCKVRTDSVVASQQVALAGVDSLVRIVSSTNFELEGDNLHYNGKAQYLYGYTDAYNRIYNLTSNYPFPMSGSTTPAASS